MPTLILVLLYNILNIERTKQMKVKLINGAMAPKHGRKGDAGYDFFLSKSEGNKKFLLRAMYLMV